ncbi:hypothetical protein PIB30_055704 [Stylosanthes scabra]|uniref:Uncharacterized protein n=1 Tax=Stylosanthes scabra TaxID=79078 RepID=A0ABU6VHM0_9FABA|nr:hypothetical protein [Stylosanthes scabra]
MAVVGRSIRRRPKAASLGTWAKRGMEWPQNVVVGFMSYSTDPEPLEILIGYSLVVLFSRRAYLTANILNGLTSTFQRSEQSWEVVLTKLKM